MTTSEAKNKVADKYKYEDWNDMIDNIKTKKLGLTEDEAYEEAMEIYAQSKALKELILENEKLKNVIQEFVDRVDKGEIRSKYTYAKFKKLLSV